MAKPNDYFSDTVTTLTFFLVNVRLLISKSEEIINFRTVNSFKAEFSKNGAVVNLLNNNKRQQSRYFQKHGVCSDQVLSSHSSRQLPTVANNENSDALFKFFF